MSDMRRSALLIVPRRRLIASKSHAPVALRRGLFVFVWLSDNSRLAVLVLLVLLVVFVIIAIVGVARRHRIADEVHPSETVFR
jgi:hypothetical protein